jgi:hypothetical protein
MSTETLLRSLPTVCEVDHICGLNFESHNESVDVLVPKTRMIAARAC